LLSNGDFFGQAGSTTMITLTEAAQRECDRRLGTSDPALRVVRIGLRPGGCAGTKYVVECGAAEGPDDHVFEQGSLRVLCDPASLPSLDGLQIDFVAALMGGGFRFANPQAATSCACGDSFATR
jgi:iron-sulfur cluster assembly protein